MLLILDIQPIALLEAYRHDLYDALRLIPLHSCQTGTRTTGASLRFDKRARKMGKS